MKKILTAISDKYSIDPITLVDIGARWGVQRPWNNFPEQSLRYYGFDADVEECARLNAANKLNHSVVYLPAALFDKESEETLYLTAEEGCSSIYKPNEHILNRYFFRENWRVKREIRVTTTTLKNVFSKNQINPDFLKIDTQGAELNILRGAADSLDSVIGLELEVEFIEAYKGQPLFSDIDSFVRAKGFELFDLNRYWANRFNTSKRHLNRGQLVFGDAVYFRTPDSFYSLNISPELRKEKLLKMVLILSLYGFFDSAAAYVDHESSPLNTVEKSALVEVLLAESEFPAWHRILFDNRVAAKLGRFVKMFGNLLSFSLNTYGWGTDYNGVDGRFPYFRKEGKYFRKS